MTHKEFKLKVVKDILEINSRQLNVVQYKIGDTITVDEETFQQLKEGKIVSRFTSEGRIDFSKSNFENEVETTIITVEHTINKLGNRK